MMLWAVLANHHGLPMVVYMKIPAVAGSRVLEFSSFVAGSFSQLSWSAHGSYWEVYLKILRISKSELSRAV